MGSSVMTKAPDAGIVNCPHLLDSMVYWITSGGQFTPAKDGLDFSKKCMETCNKGPLHGEVVGAHPLPFCLVM